MKPKFFAFAAANKDSIVFCHHRPKDGYSGISNLMDSAIFPTV